MKGQQITPWTFLKEAPQAQNQQQSKPHINQVKFRLPKILKKRDAFSKQQDESHRNYLRSKKQGKHIKTMVLSQMKSLYAQSIYPLKKKTEPLLYKETSNDEKITENVEILDNLYQVKLITDFIRNSLEQESKFTPNRKLPSQSCLAQISQKKISIPQSFGMMRDSLTIRIHDKNLDSNISALRSILKKQRANRNKMSGKTSILKHTNHISLLKLKLTEEASQLH